MRRYISTTVGFSAGPEHVHVRVVYGMAGWIVVSLHPGSGRESGVRRCRDLCATLWLIGKDPGAGSGVQGTWLALVCAFYDWG